MKPIQKFWITLILVFSFLWASQCVPEQIPNDKNAKILAEPAENIVTNFSLLFVQDWLEIKWQTTNEERILGYELQQSENGQNFITIKWEPSFRTTEGASYLITEDIKVYGKKLAYRLKIIYENDSFSYTKSKEIKMPSEVQLLKLQEKLESL